MGLNERRCRIGVAIRITTVLGLIGTAVCCAVAAEPAASPPSLALNDAGAEAEALTWLAGAPVGLTLTRGSGAPEIDAVPAGGAAERAGLRRGDTLVLVDHALVPRAGTAAAQIQAAWAAQKAGVDMVVSRQGHDLYLVLPLPH